MTAIDILTAGAIVAGWGLFFWLGRTHARDIEQKLRDTQAMPTPSRWQALPGGRLELAATGYAIEHRPHDKRADFWLYSPEGQMIVAVPPGQLEPLKQLAERMAAERDEFAPSNVQSFPAIGQGSNRAV